MDEYQEFLARKTRAHVNTGIEVDSVHPALFEWQKAVVKWALQKGRACLFEDTGLGKSRQALAWAQKVPGDVLLLTPLAVTGQFVMEAEKIGGIDCRISRDGSVNSQITIANYEQLHKFDLARFTGMVLDESSIIKSQDGHFRNAILEGARSIPFKLACTATPAPNDHVELGNHAEFVGAMSRVEMLATFFCHDGGDTSEWRLKGHAKADFWRWVATWAMMIRTPADIGYDAGNYILPKLHIHEHIIDSGIRTEGALFAMPAEGLLEQRNARRKTLEMRVDKVAEIVAKEPNEPWIVWAELNDEGDALESAITGSVQVSGSDDDEVKAKNLVGFAKGDFKILVTKPKIAGFGLNYQHAARMAFVGLSHSWEAFYQAVRREYRFGQSREVHVHIVSTDVELAVLQNIKQKQAMADTMAAEMVQYMEATMKAELGAVMRRMESYERETVEGRGWTMHRGDCVDIVRELPDNSIDFSVYSLPFSSLYTYSASDRDMGNTSNDHEFFSHYGFLARDLFRVTKPGRLVAIHCMDLPATKERDGYIGLRDFPGDIIRCHQAEGWIWHSKVTIWKDPVTAMQRTKALGLLHKQIKKDSARNRQGIPDYLIIMFKPGDNPKPITHTNESFPVEMWQRYASPVWVTVEGVDNEGFGICTGKTNPRDPSSSINPSDTLQKESAREAEDDRHICPLQLGVIRRAMELWSAPGDLVLSPFAGIGSEGYVALEMKREFVGCELKGSYFKQACLNLAAAGKQTNLFGG